MRHAIDGLTIAVSSATSQTATTRHRAARRFGISLGILVVFAACGGGDASSKTPDSPTEPVPPTVGPAASLAMQSGDGQSAFPGGALAITPVVVVRDANGRAVPGATVTFAVVSGGGTIANGTATSDALGLASAGRWTVGASGAQMLEARLGSLPVVRFSATIATDPVQSVIPPAGGTIEITTPGHPYRGLTLTIPDGAYPDPGTWRIELAVGAPTPTLPAGFTVSGPALRIDSDRARAGRLMTMRIPAPRVPGFARFFVVADPTRSVREILPIVAQDSASITVMFGHLSPSLLLGRSANPIAALTRQAAATNTALNGWLTSVDLNALGITGTMLLNYLNEIFPAADVGSYAYPTGHGPATALLNVYSQLSNQFLSAQVKVTPFGTLADTATFATLQIMANQHRVSTVVRRALDDYSAALAKLPVATRDSLTALNLWGGLAISSLPQLMMFEERFGASPGRRSFATMFGSSNGTTRYASATAPSTTSTLALGPSGFSSRIDKEVADALPLNAQGVLPLGGSFVYPVEESRSFYDKMLAALAKQGAARQQANTELAAEANFPDVAFEVQSAATGAWAPMDTTIVIRDSSAQLRARCSNCTQALPQTSVSVHPGIPSASQMLVALGLPDLSGAAMSNFDPVQVLSQLAAAFRPTVPFRVRLTMALFKVAPDSQLVAPDSLVQFNTTVSLPPPKGYVIDWDFGDNTAAVRVNNAVGASHRYATTGTFEVTATLRNGPNSSVPNLLLATSKAKVVVKSTPAPYWRFTSVTLMPRAFEGEEGEYDQKTAFLRVAAAPLAGLLAVDTVSPGVVRVALRVRTASTFAGVMCCAPPVTNDELSFELGRTPSTTYPFGAFFTAFRSGTWTQSTSDLNAGTMSAASAVGTFAYQIRNAGVQTGPQIAYRLADVVRSGNTMTGKISFWNWNIEDPLEPVDTDAAETWFTFTAVRLR